jgi:predicted RNA-binding Zn ribbon-like protein
MVTSTDPARMRLVGGDLALDYVNTRTGTPGETPDEDVLGDYAGVLAWARYVGIVEEVDARRLAQAAGTHPALARRVFRRARNVRDELDRLFRSIASGDPPPDGARAALRDAVADALARAELVPGDDGFGWSWARDETLARPLGPVVYAAVDLLTGGPLDRLKACPGCGFLFLDESKNRSRRWCSMDDCGAAEKMRRYVRRRKGRTAISRS